MSWAQPVLCGGGAHNSTQAIGRLPATNVNLGPAVPAVEADIASHGKNGRRMLRIESWIVW